MCRVFVLQKKNNKRLFILGLIGFVSVPELPAPFVSCPAAEAGRRRASRRVGVPRGGCVSQAACCGHGRMQGGAVAAGCESWERAPQVVWLSGQGLCPGPAQGTGLSEGSSSLGSCSKVCWGGGRASVCLSVCLPAARRGSAVGALGPWSRGRRGEQHSACFCGMEGAGAKLASEQHRGEQGIAPAPLLPP